MSEYIPKYPSKEGDDSNKTSSELLAETLKPIYVPQDLMLAWESHLASYSRDTNVLLDQVKDSELALNTQYQALLARVQKYEQMLQDITMDSNEFTMDTDEVNFTGWNILAQASYWDYLLRKEITKLSDQIKSVEYRGVLVADVSDSVLESLSTGNQHISNIIGAVTNSPLIRDLDAALSGTSTGLSDLRLAHEALKAKQYADAIALADQNGETFNQLTLTFNNLISEQITKIADEAATRTRVFQELEDGITVESQLRHEGQETIATAVFALKASTETSIAGIKQEYSTIAGTNEAITSALTTYTAQVDGTLATILTDYIAYANLDYALTSKSDKLLAIVNDNIGKLNITNEIQAGLTSIKALSTVTVDLNGVVSGYGLISELENGIVKSSFGVNADTFYIGKPTDAVKPFVVTTTPTNIDGVDFPAGTWINSAIIADATIGSAHITDAAITNAKIFELDASKITTGVLNAGRIRVGPTSSFDAGYNPATKARTFITQPTVPYSVGDIWKNGTSTYICKTQRVAGSFTASEWDKVGDVTSENTAANSNALGGTTASTINTNITNADTKATNAASTATAADTKATAADTKATLAQSAANSANNQVNAWKFTGTTDIDGGKIRADTVTAVQIDVAELSAISANLGTIMVGNANIEDAAINNAKISNGAVGSINIVDGAVTTAKIGDLQVDTLKIKDDAVSIGVGAQGVHTLSAVSNGGKMRLDVGIQSDPNLTLPGVATVYVRVLRNGIVIRVFTFPGLPVGGNESFTYYKFPYVCALPPIIESFASGTSVTYSIQVAALDHSNAYVSPDNGGAWLKTPSISMAITELKK